MLPRTAARAVRSGYPLSSSRAVITPQLQWRRHYARSDKPRAPPKPQPARPTIPNPDLAANGPVTNKTWSPDKGIRFSAAPSAPGQQLDGTVIKEVVLASKPAYAESPVNDLKSDFLPQSNAPAQQEATTQTTGPDVISQPPPTSTTTSAPTSDAKLRHASEPSPVETHAPPPLSTEPLPDLRQGLPPSGLFAEKDTTPAASGAEDSQAPQSTTPLPDLRQGIPSTFGQEPSFKDKDAESPSLNLTENPAFGGGRRTGNDEQTREYISSIDRRRNQYARLAYLFVAAFTVVGGGILGRSWEEDDAKMHSAPNGWSPGAIWGRIKERTGGQLGYYTEPAFGKLLPDMDPSMRAPYTLVLSLEDLLVASKWDRNKGWQVAKRPGVDYFLRYLSQYYELVIFTSVASMNADPVIRKLDPFRIVSWPLFREGTRYMDGEHVKVRSILCPSLSDTNNFT
jgi:hypothetical protein